VRLKKVLMLFLQLQPILYLDPHYLEYVQDHLNIFVDCISTESSESFLFSESMLTHSKLSVNPLLFHCMKTYKNQ